MFIEHSKFGSIDSSSVLRPSSLSHSHRHRATLLALHAPNVVRRDRRLAATRHGGQSLRSHHAQRNRSRAGELCRLRLLLHSCAGGERGVRTAGERVRRSRARVGERGKRGFQRGARLHREVVALGKVGTRRARGRPEAVGNGRERGVLRREELLGGLRWRGGKGETGGEEAERCEAEGKAGVEVGLRVELGMEEAEEEAEGERAKRERRSGAGQPFMFMRNTLQALR